MLPHITVRTGIKIYENTKPITTRTEEGEIQELGCNLNPRKGYKIVKEVTSDYFQIKPHAKVLIYRFSINSLLKTKLSIAIV